MRCSLACAERRSIKTVLWSLARNPISGQLATSALATNAAGIYVLDCAGKNVYLARARIVGTLVVKNGKNLQIVGPMVAEPAIYNYPVLLSNDVMSISFDGSTLSES